MTVSPSSKTYGNIYNELNLFISKNQDADKLEEAAKEAGYNVLSNIPVYAMDQTVGSIKNSRPVVRWAFQNEKGDISEILKDGENSKESVAKVSKISKNKLDSYNLKNYKFCENNILKCEVLASSGNYNNAQNVSVAIRTYGDYSYSLYLW